MNLLDDFEKINLTDEVSIKAVEASGFLETNMYTAISGAFLRRSHDN